MSVRTPRKKGKIRVRENTKGKGDKSGGWEYQGKRKKIGRAQTRRRNGKNMMGKGENRVARKTRREKGKIGSAGTLGEWGKVGAQGHQGAKTRERKGKRGKSSGAKTRREKEKLGRARIRRGREKIEWRENTKGKRRNSGA